MWIRGQGLGVRLGNADLGPGIRGRGLGAEDYGPRIMGQVLGDR